MKAINEALHDMQLNDRENGTVSWINTPSLFTCQRPSKLWLLPKTRQVFCEECKFLFAPYWIVWLCPFRKARQHKMKCFQHHFCSCMLHLTGSVLVLKRPQINHSYSRPHQRASGKKTLLLLENKIMNGMAVFCQRLWGINVSAAGLTEEAAQLKFECTFCPARMRR